MAKGHDNFLADAVGPRSQRVGYMDGFRFGFGMTIGFLLVGLILGGLTWGLIAALHLH